MKFLFVWFDNYSIAYKYQTKIIIKQRISTMTIILIFTLEKYYEYMKKIQNKKISNDFTKIRFCHNYAKLIAVKNAIKNIKKTGQNKN